MSKLLIAASFVALSSAANAASYVLSYEDLTENQYGAVLTADLDADGNTLVSIAVSSFTINGVTYPATTVDSLSNIFASSGNDVALTLDGTFVDFLVSDEAAGAGNGFGFLSDFFASDAFISSVSDGFEAFNLAGYSLVESAVSAVPLPAALPLSIAALGGLGLIGARRRKAA